MINPFFQDSSDIAERVYWKNDNASNKCSIAKVVGINSSPVSVNIQPLVNYFDQSIGWTPYPILSFVPLAQMQTVLYSINLPLNIGDTGLVLWFDREVYTTLLAGAISPQAPESGDMNNVSACVFIPMLSSFNIASQIKNTGIDILSAEVSLLTQLINLCMQTSALATALGQGGIATAVTAIQEQLAAFKGEQP